MPRSRVYLPKLETPPPSILEYLVYRFPHIPISVWQSRISRGLVITSAGLPLTEKSPYQHGLTVFYTREVASEPAPSETEVLLYRDDELLVVDKPHGLPVTPAGEYVARCLLNRLQEQTGIADLVPLHRLDRDTAGIVLFGAKPGSRKYYHELFAKGDVEREYLAVAAIPKTPNDTRWIVRNRLAPGEPWFRQRVVRDQSANSLTRIELIESHDGLGLFLLKPGTGKKHQLRVHMDFIGFPILGDPLYPDIVTTGTFDLPLQLLASRLAFTDPISGKRSEFKSARRLGAISPGWTIGDSVH